MRDVEFREPGVVVDDDPEPRGRRHSRVDGLRQHDREVLVGLDLAVALDRDADRL